MFYFNYFKIIYIFLKIIYIFYKQNKYFTDNKNILLIIKCYKRKEFDKECVIIV